MLENLLIRAQHEHVARCFGAHISSHGLDHTLEALKRRKTERLAKPGTNKPAADAVPVEDPDEELSLEELTALWFEKFGVTASSADDDPIIPRDPVTMPEIELPVGRRYFSLVGILVIWFEN